MEAAVHKAKLKQEKMRENRKQRELAKKEGYISKSVKIGKEEDFEIDEDEMNSEDDEMYDSDALVYDSEEEAEAEERAREDMMKFVMNGKGKKAGEVEEPSAEYDANEQVKKNQKYKAAPGVKFEEFDENGFRKNDELAKFVNTEDTVPDVFIQAPPEMIEKAKMRPVGVFRDYDMDVNNIDDEKKALLDCLVDSD